MNGLSYGWWLCNAYRFNDADHLLMFREGITEGENRARVTSGVITGIYMNGDDLTLAGPKVAKERVKKFFTNAEINRIARIGRSFRPVYGYRPTANGRAENFLCSNRNRWFMSLLSILQKTGLWSILWLSPI
ncbi:MAG: hypothetical protein ACLU30_09210 [Odoribacter splanchnicus]